jgi:hypothetical protein
MRVPYLERFRALTNGSTPVYIILPPVKPGHALFVTDISLYNDSGEQISFTPGIFRMGEFIGIGYSSLISNGLSYNWAALTAWLGEGDFFAERVTGIALAGRVTLSVSGWLYDTDPLMLPAYEQA